MNLHQYKIDYSNPMEFVLNVIRVLGIEVIINFDAENKWYVVDFNTQAKSHLYLHIPEDLQENKAFFTTRYNKEKQNNIKDFCDLLWEVKDCMYGRDYVNEQWLKVLVEHDILRVEYKTVRTIYQ